MTGDVVDPAIHAVAFGPALRELRAELARVRDQLRAEDQSCGYQPSPGHAKRRAQLLRHDRAILDAIRQLDKQPPDQLGGRRTV